MRKPEPCPQGWDSKGGEIGFVPNPCTRCGWSENDHASWEARRDARTETIAAINQALKCHGLIVGWSDGQYIVGKA
jgi:hypothetical protein